MPDIQMCPAREYQCPHVRNCNRNTLSGTVESDYQAYGGIPIHRDGTCPNYSPLNEDFSKATYQAALRRTLGYLAAMSVYATPQISRNNQPYRDGFIDGWIKARDAMLRVLPDIIDTEEEGGSSYELKKFLSAPVDEEFATQPGNANEGYSTAVHAVVVGCCSILFSTEEASSDLWMSVLSIVTPEIDKEGKVVVN